VYQHCQRKDLSETKSDKCIHVLIGSLGTVFGTLCFTLLRLMKVVPSYFQQYLAGYSDIHFDGYEDLIFCASKLVSTRCSRGLDYYIHNPC